MTSDRLASKGNVNKKMILEVIHKDEMDRDMIQKSMRKLGLEKKEDDKVTDLTAAEALPRGSAALSMPPSILSGVRPTVP